MTKQIRIENADTSTWPVRVTVQHKNAAGKWVDVGSTQIDHATNMAVDYLTSIRRLVIEEKPATPPPVSSP